MIAARATNSRRRWLAVARSLQSAPMYPILFTIPGIDFKVRSFGVMLALGFLFASWVFAKLATGRERELGATADKVARIPVWVLIGIVLGARLMYVVVEALRGSDVGREFLDEPWKVLAVWEGGLVMYGGLFGGMLFGSWCAFKNDVKVAPAMDIGLISGFFGYGVGRIGCFLVGDDYGARVPERFADLPFPIVLRVPDPLPAHSLFGDENAGQALWATQPWMSVNGFVLALLGLWLLKRRAFAGQVSLILIVLYAITRSVIEHFRGDEIRGVWFGGALSTSQLVSMVAGAIALAWLVALQLRARPRTAG